MLLDLARTTTDPWRLDFNTVFAVHHVTVLSAPVAIATITRALRQTSGG